MILRTSFDNLDDSKQAHIDDHEQLHQRFNRTRTLKDYGAVGDGTTDDAEAIQEAIRGGHGFVCFPPGDYRCGSNIVIDSQLVTMGQGATLHFDSGAGLIVKGAAASGSQITNLALRGVSGIGLDIQRSDAGWAASRLSLCNLDIRGFDVGLKLDRVMLSSIDRCHFQSAPVQLLNSGHTNVFRGCWFRGIPKGNYGVVTDAQYSLTFWGCTWSARNTGGSGLWVRNLRQWGLYHCHFEDLHSDGGADSPDGVGIVLGESGEQTYWGSGIVSYCNFLDMGTVVRVDKKRLYDGATLDMRTVRKTNVATLVDAGDTSKEGGQILCPTLDGVINDPNGLCIQQGL